MSMVSLPAGEVAELRAAAKDAKNAIEDWQEQFLRADAAEAELVRLRDALKIARYALTGQWAPMIVNGAEVTGIVTPKYAIDFISAALGTKP
jgi:hypothetical protein